MASSKKGAMGVGISLNAPADCVDYFRDIFPYAGLVKDEKYNLPLIKALKSALSGRQYIDELPLDMDVTPFQELVLRETAKIPFGQTRTYGDIAWSVNRPKGARAIGQVMNRNPLPLIFPCHRVVAAKGVGGFGGGIELKKYLLEREGISYA